MSESSQPEHRASEAARTEGRWARFNLLQRLAIVLLFFAGVAILFGAYLLHSVDSDTFGPYLRMGDWEHLEEQGDRLRVALEAYRTEHGRYPESLAEAGIAPADMQTKFGDWRWTHDRDEAVFELAVGDYGVNFFTLRWSPGMEHWYMDQ